MSIKDPPLDTRPRKKLLARNPAGPGEAKLLALPLRASAWPEGEIPLSDELLAPNAPAARKWLKAQWALEQP